MPLYTYRCEKCGYEWDQHTSVEHRNERRSCPDYAKHNYDRLSGKRVPTTQYAFRMGKEGILHSPGRGNRTGSIDPYSGQRLTFGYGKSGTTTQPGNYGSE